MTITDQSIEDLRRAQFLQRLDHAPLQVTPAEHAFMETILQGFELADGGFNHLQFAPRQREEIDRMRTEYQRRIS